MDKSSKQGLAIEMAERGVVNTLTEDNENNYLNRNNVGNEELLARGLSEVFDNQPLQTEAEEIIDQEEDRQFWEQEIDRNLREAVDLRFRKEKDYINF